MEGPEGDVSVGEDAFPSPVGGVTSVVPVAGGWLDSPGGVWVDAQAVKKMVRINKNTMFFFIKEAPFHV